MNLYGYGYGESYMELHSDGTVDYPGQPLLDVDNALNPAGDWYNTDGSSMGNQGNVTPAAITWGLTVPGNNAGAVAAGWRDNRLYFTDGSSFVVPGGGIRGDVNQDGNVSIADVTALIDLLLAGNEIADDIKAVREATRGVILKVIIECCLLTEEEKIKMCQIVSDSGADFIKTSTGFSTGGATFADVELMRANCLPSVQVKAAGGISSIEDAEKFIALGATRLGTSRIVKIAMAMEKETQS
jgi:hypothetical protein